MTIEKYAAIDIGSNAVRLLITNVIKESSNGVKFKKSTLVRVPIRLGQDTFTSGAISEESTIKMIDTMNAFRLLMKANNVVSYMACATSAVREAENADTVIARIKKESGINVIVIDGKKEAEIIASTDLKTLIDTNKTYMYVDVGGGSTEFTVFSNGQLIASKSFKIGTVRLLNKTEDIDVWKNIETWIEKETKIYDRVIMIGSGGNINKIHKLTGKTNDKPLSYIYLNAQYHFYNSMTYEDRVSELGLNPDRADVIIPALQIYLNAMKWASSKKMYVPKIGLADGIIKTIYATTQQKIKKTL